MVPPCSAGGKLVDWAAESYRERWQRVALMIVEKCVRTAAGRPSFCTSRGSAFGRMLGGWLALYEAL